MENYRRSRHNYVIQAILWLLCAGPTLGSLDGQADIRWRDITRELGITSPIRLPNSGHYRLTDTFTGRAVPFDYDGDNDLDLLVTYGPQPADSLYSGLNLLFRQDDSAWVDVTAETGLSRFPPASNAAVGDVDGDGYPDLYLSLFGSDRLLHNDEGRGWLDVTDSAGIANGYWSTEAVFFDANGDGYLDLYVANYVVNQGEDTLVCRDPRTGRQTVCDPQIYDPAPNKLLVNDGTGRFTDLTDSLGLADTTSRSLGVILLDANSDGFMDLLVLSDGSPNLLYLNRADSGFVQAGILSGVALAPDGTEPAWSHVVPLDANGDGHVDLLFTRRTGELDLLLNNGSAQFFEGHHQAGLFQPRFPYRGTSAAVLDLDFNGTPDLLLADKAAAVAATIVVSDTTEADTLGAGKMVTGEPLPNRARRILLADENHRFRAAGGPLPMLLETTLLVPRLARQSPKDPSVDFLFQGTFDQPQAPRGLGGTADPADPGTFTVPGGSNPAAPSAADSMLGDTGIPGSVDRAAANISGAPSGGLLRRGILDTLEIRQEADRYVVADLTGDGVQEIVAVYPVGHFRVWQRILERRPRFLGLWPTAGGPGKVIVGAELEVTGIGMTRRMLLTDTNPRVIYLPRRVRRVEVVMRWPEGGENRYRTRQLNRYYRINRKEGP